MQSNKKMSKGVVSTDYTPSAQLRHVEKHTKQNEVKRETSRDTHTYISIQHWKTTITNGKKVDETTKQRELVFISFFMQEDWKTFFPVFLWSTWNSFICKVWPDFVMFNVFLQFKWCYLIVWLIGRKFFVWTVLLKEN